MNRFALSLIVLLYSLFFVYIVIEVAIYIGLIRSGFVIDSLNWIEGRFRSLLTWEHYIAFKMWIFAVLVLVYSYIFERYDDLNVISTHKRWGLFSEAQVATNMFRRTIMSVFMQVKVFFPDPLYVRGIPFILIASFLPTYIMYVARETLESVLYSIIPRGWTLSRSPGLLVGMLVTLFTIVMIVAVTLISPFAISRDDDTMVARIIACIAMSGVATALLAAGFSKSQNLSGVLEEAYVDSVVTGFTFSIVSLLISR